MVTYQPILISSPSSLTPGHLSIINFVRVTTDSMSTEPFIARVPLGVSVSCYLQGIDSNPFSIDITERSVVKLRTQCCTITFAVGTGTQYRRFRSTINHKGHYDPNEQIQMSAQNADRQFGSTRKQLTRTKMFIHHSSVTICHPLLTVQGPHR